VAHDYSVIATWATDGTWYYLVDVWRRRVEFPELVRAVEAQAAEHSPSAIVIEDAGPAQSALQVLDRDTALPIIPVKATGSKISRAESVSPLFEAGKVLLPEQAPSWLGDWIEEHVTFPGRHDDQVDTTSLALDRLRDSGRAGGGVAGVVIRDWRQPPEPPAPPTVEEARAAHEAAKARRRVAQEARRRVEVAAFRDPRYDAP
jgi:predicted phage terminase large subunit-like protein